MKLYVVIVSYPYEGFGQPRGVFSTEDLALKAADHYDATHNKDMDCGGDAHILEYDIDVAMEAYGLGAPREIDTAKQLRAKVFRCLNRAVGKKYDLTLFTSAHDIAVDLVTYADDCKERTPDELVPHVEAWLAERTVEVK